MSLLFVEMPLQLGIYLALIVTTLDLLDFDRRSSPQSLADRFRCGCRKGELAIARGGGERERERERERQRDWGDLLVCASSQRYAGQNWNIEICRTKPADSEQETW